MTASRPGALRPSGLDVLVVCTGNFTRSPYIAWDLRRRAGSQLQIASAGTHAVAARQGADPRVVSTLRTMGVGARALRHHRAQRVSRELVERASLVITATREHRGQLNSLAPESTDRIFTLLELAHLLAKAGEIDSELGGLAPHLASIRDDHLAADATTDLADPLGRSTKSYQTMIETVEAALDVVSPHVVSSIRAYPRGA